MKRLIYTLLAILYIGSLGVSAQGGSYRLKVGNLYVPLRLVSAPNNYNGRVEAYKEDILTAIKEPISLLHNNVPVYKNKLMFYFLPNKRNPGDNLISYTMDLVQGAKLPADIIKQISDQLQPGDNITIQSMGVGEEISVNSAAIAVKDPNAPYKAPMYPQYNNESEIFSFQIVGGLPKPLLKVDTLQEVNKRIVRIYSDKKKYDMVHMPGFTTKNRYIKPTDTFWPEDEIAKTIVFSKQKTKPYYLYPEVAVASEYSTVLRWGAMNAAPLSQAHSVSVFKENMNKPIELNVPNENLSLYHAEVIIIPDRGDNIRYIIDNINDPKIQEVFAKVGDKSTIYFQNILVKDTQGTVKLYPITYGYLVAENKETK